MRVLLRFSFRKPLTPGTSPAEPGEVRSVASHDGCRIGIIVALPSSGSIRNAHGSIVASRIIASAIRVRSVLHVVILGVVEDLLIAVALRVGDLSSNPHGVGQSAFDAIEGKKGFKCTQCGKVFCVTSVLEHAPQPARRGRAGIVCVGQYMRFE